MCPSLATIQPPGMPMLKGCMQSAHEGRMPDCHCHVRTQESMGSCSPSSHSERPARRHHAGQPHADSLADLGKLPAVTSTPTETQHCDVYLLFQVDGNGFYHI